MTEKNHSNAFKFCLTQGDVVLGEKYFNADDFNPFTRYSIDIREILRGAITSFQKVLSRRKYCTKLYDYDLFTLNKNEVESFPREMRNELKYSPKPIRNEIEGKVIKGVECKIGLYINDNPIVERLFYVDGFNNIAKESVDVLDTVVSVTDIIYNLIKKNDIQNMWDDYDLINKKGLTINQIRDLSIGKRRFLLSTINRY